MVNQVQPGAPDESFERRFRDVLAHFATGVAVVTALEGERPLGMTVQSFCSLSLAPPLILLCPSLTSATWPAISRAGRLCINLLAEGQAAMARQFALSGADKYRGISWEPSPETGSPILVEGLAWIDCEIEHEYPGGDHRVVVCRVLDLQARSQRAPLVFFQSGFQRIASSQGTVGEVRSVLLAVADMDAACRYYGEGLGMTPLLRDGDRYAAFAAGGYNIALSGSAQAMPDPVAVSLRVADVRSALERAVAAGATLVEEPSRHEHEMRAAVRDPDGHLFYLYSPAPSEGG